MKKKRSYSQLYKINVGEQVKIRPKRYREDRGFPVLYNEAGNIGTVTHSENLKLRVLFPGGIHRVYHRVELFRYTPPEQKNLVRKCSICGVVLTDENRATKKGSKQGGTSYYCRPCNSIVGGIRVLRRYDPEKLQQTYERYKKMVERCEMVIQGLPLMEAARKEAEKWGNSAED